MNVLFDKRSAIGLMSRWVPRDGGGGGLPEMAVSTTFSASSAMGEAKRRFCEAARLYRSLFEVPDAL